MAEKKQNEPLVTHRYMKDGQERVVTGTQKEIDDEKPIADARPEIWDIFDDDAVVRELSDINGVPAKVMRSVDAVIAMREERNKAAQEAQQIANMKEAAVTTEKFAKAADISQPATEMVQ